MGVDGGELGGSEMPQYPAHVQQLQEVHMRPLAPKPSELEGKLFNRRRKVVRRLAGTVVLPPSPQKVHQKERAQTHRGGESVKEFPGLHEAHTNTWPIDQASVQKDPGSHRKGSRKEVIERDGGP